LCNRTIIDRDADELDGFAARVRYFQDFAIMLGVEEVSPDQFQIDGIVTAENSDDQESGGDNSDYNF